MCRRTGPGTGLMEHEVWGMHNVTTKGGRSSVEATRGGSEVNTKAVQKGARVTKEERARAR